MPRVLLMLAGLALFAIPASAQTADEIVAKYVKTVGGAEKIQAVKSLRRSGKFIGGGGFEAAILEENKRANMVRQEFSLQGLTGINAYDGKTGWKIEPWQGKKLAGVTIPEGHPNGYPIYRLEWQSLGSLKRRLRNCLVGSRAESYAFDAPEYVALEMYLMDRAKGMMIEAPGVRP